MSEPLHVGFVLCSNAAQPLPSTRIAVINMLPWLAEAGMRTTLLFDPPYASETPELQGVAERAIAQRCRVVVLQKVHGPSALALVRRLTAANVRTVYVVCDLVDAAMAESTDATVVVTDYLKSLYPDALQSRIHVVHDGIEKPLVHKDDAPPGDAGGRAALRAVLVTSMQLNRLPVLESVPAWLRVRIVGRYASGWRRWREVRWALSAQTAGQRKEFLRFLVEPRIRCIPWNPEDAYQQMLAADIGIIPVETSCPTRADGMPPAWQVKSENRLSMKMSMGLPVVATPIPAYEPLIEHGVNGFFARSARDWLACLHSLRDPLCRRAMGLAARATVIDRYSMREQARRLVLLLRQVGTPAR